MNANPTNSGFEGLHNQSGMLLVIAGFAIVGMFIIAGAVFSRAIEKEHRLKREAAREAANTESRD